MIMINAEAEETDFPLGETREKEAKGLPGQASNLDEPENDSGSSATLQNRLLVPSDSYIIGTLKPYVPNSSNTISTNSKTLTALPRLSRLSIPTGNRKSESGSKVWMFEQSSTKRRMTVNAPIIFPGSIENGSDTPRLSSQAIGQISPGTKENESNQVENFLNYEESSRSIELENDQKKSQGNNQAPSPFENKTEKSNSPDINEEHRSRTNSIKKFRERQEFLRLITLGKESDLAKIEKFLQEDPSQFIYEFGDPMALVNKPTPNGQRPLYVAAKNGNLEIIKLLVKYGANPKLKSCFKTGDEGTLEDSLLEATVRWGAVHILQYLLEQFEWTKNELKYAMQYASSPLIKGLLSENGMGNQKKREAVLKNSFLGASFGQIEYDQRERDNSKKNSERDEKQLEEMKQNQTQSTKKKLKRSFGCFSCFSSKSPKKHS